MNHMPLRSLSAVASVRRPTQRALAKQRTREKILAAAKTLFTEKGYEGATIRDIAAAAGMSTGAVFASFTDKSDLFNEIIAADRDALYEAMHEAAQKATARGARVEDALLAMFEVGHQFHLGDLPLLLATIAASWSPQLGRQVRGRLERKPVTDLIAEVLGAAVERGELRRAADIALLSQMLWDCYLANFRHAAFDAWGAEALKARLREQMGVILASSRTD
jgi:AcrR family transcriptional regulator